MAVKRCRRAPEVRWHASKCSCECLQAACTRSAGSECGTCKLVAVSMLMLLLESVKTLARFFPRPRIARRTTYHHKKIN